MLQLLMSGVILYYQFPESQEWISLQCPQQNFIFPTISFPWPIHVAPTTSKEVATSQHELLSTRKSRHKNCYLVVFVWLFLKSVNNNKHPTDCLSINVEQKQQFGIYQLGIPSHQLLLSAEMKVKEHFPRMSTESLYFSFVDWERVLFTSRHQVHYFPLPSHLRTSECSNRKNTVSLYVVCS